MRAKSISTALVSVLIMLSCGPADNRCNVVIIAVDTLRPDHLGCYGYFRSTSPNIDRMAAQGVLCENAVSQAPWTLPSFTTVLTSLYPTQHGAVRLGNGLRDQVPTLAEVLRERGYATGAVVNAPTLKPKTGVNRGFDTYDARGLDERLADGTTQDVLAWIDENDDRPFFMFAHYFDPHRPYAPPAPYHRLYESGYEGPIGDSFNLEGFSLLKSEMCEQMKVLTAEDWQRIMALYDGEIAFTDREIGNLLDGLKSRGLERKTLLVFLSDHGEEFYDHGCYGHGHSHSLFDELIKVPLVFSMPARLPSASRIKRQIRLVDVTPTILDLIGIKPPMGFEGVSLTPLLENSGDLRDNPNATLPHDLAFSESLSEGPELKCISRYPWKLIYDTVTQDSYLYRLDTDPGEHNNMASMEPDILNSLHNALFPALFHLSATWFIELAGGEDGHRFDLRVQARRAPGIGRIHLYKLLDLNGGVVDAEKVLTRNGSGSILDLCLSNLKDTYTVAFQVVPPDFPIEVDVSIDGRKAADSVYLGEDLANPAGLPVAFRARRQRVTCTGRPGGFLECPYVLIWLEKSAYGTDVVVEHDENTKRELRALGYIQ